MSGWKENEWIDEKMIVYLGINVKRELVDRDIIDG